PAKKAAAPAAPDVPAAAAPVQNIWQTTRKSKKDPKRFRFGSFSVRKEQLRLLDDCYFPKDVV
ncbi:MAG: hypothetical protein IJE98_06795, partial [Oscillospiraceae bacterium]|nr:hypothetical protein [Oscillospiraceae bacterium]